jgi:hypothetical protein
MAEKLEERARNLAHTIVDLEKRIQQQVPRKLKSQHQIFSDERLTCLRTALNIVEKYKASGALTSFDPMTVREDLVHISALNINVAEMSGLLLGRVQVGEDSLKLARARVRMDIRREMEILENEGRRIKITDKDIECLAREKSSDILDEVSEDRTISEYVRFTYFAIQEFNRVLQSAAVRVSSAEHQNAGLS